MLYFLNKKCPFRIKINPGRKGDRRVYSAGCRRQLNDQRTGGEILPKNRWLRGVYG